MTAIIVLVYACSPRDDTVTVDRTDTPSGYGVWLAGLKRKIREARLRPSLAVNSELIGLYWRIGRDILERQQRDGWGAKALWTSYPLASRILAGAVTPLVFGI